MPIFSTSAAVLTLAILLLLAHQAHAFGAGNIASVSKIEGINWRHGDIEDTLLQIMLFRAAGGKKFDKMNVARVYFGNWLRDYSQAIDVGTVKYVSAEAIRILLWVLGFMTFGYGTKEFEVTAERLGCYRPEDHIDNPKDYADNLDATQYDPRLRGPVNERVELAIDPRTGMKNYIANEQAGIMTSALHVRKLFGKCIQLGRSYARSKNKAELHESLRLLGTGLHCLEDFSAHSNYTELALIEMGERDVFPHVGRQVSIRLQGAQHPVYPIVTGTFGGVDFLHSVMGEFDDKATQSELQELQSTMQSGSRADTSMLKKLLSLVPSSIFGGKDQAGKADELQANAAAAQMNQMRVSPRQPEAWTRQMQQVSKEIYPIIQWHDEIMQGITETIEKIPILPDLIENIENQLNIFVFSLLAPFVVPIIEQIKTELNEGSSEVIQSSKDKQLIVFHDDHSSDPTHSMLSKDHFSNVLNEPAGKIASQVLKWVVPQLMQAIDDERIDPNRTISRIINGVFHHPVQCQFGDDGAAEGRNLIFGVVENWWRSKSQFEQTDLRRKLSRDGVMNMENHLEGVHDTGHGCGKPLGMAKSSGGANNTAAGALMGGLSSVLAGGASGGNFGGSSSFGGSNNGITQFAEESLGGGAISGLVSDLAGSLLGGAFGGSSKPETQTYASQGYTAGGGYQQNYTEVGHSGNQYAQAQYSETQYPSGGRQTDYQRYEQINSGYGAKFEERTETKPAYGGGYEQTTERVTMRPGYTTETVSSRQHHKKSDSDDRDDSDDSHKKKEKKKHHKKHSGDDRFEERREEFGGHNQVHGHGYVSGGHAGGLGEGERFEEPSRQQEYGRGDEYARGGFGGGYQEPPRQEYGGRERQDFQQRERFEEPLRQEYGGRGGFGGGYQEPRREFVGTGAFGAGDGYQEPPTQRQEHGGRDFEDGNGNEAGWGEREREDEYREERRGKGYGEQRRW